MKLLLFLISFCVLLQSCEDPNCFCEEDVMLYDNTFEQGTNLAGWSQLNNLIKLKSSYSDLGESLFILKSEKSPHASLEFVSHISGKSKIIFDAYAFDENTEISFRNITHPNQIIIPLFQKQLSHYEYSTFLDIFENDIITVEVYSSSNLDTLAFLDNLRIVMMK